MHQVQLLDVRDGQRGVRDADELAAVGVQRPGGPGLGHHPGQEVADVDAYRCRVEGLAGLAVGVPARDRPVGTAAGRRRPPLQHGLVDHRRVLDPVEQEDRLAVRRGRRRRDAPVRREPRDGRAGAVGPGCVGDPAAAERRHDPLGGRRHVDVQGLQGSTGGAHERGPVVRQDRSGAAQLAQSTFARVDDGVGGDVVHQRWVAVSAGGQDEVLGHGRAPLWHRAGRRTGHREGPVGLLPDLAARGDPVRRAPGRRATGRDDEVVAGVERVAVHVVSRGSSGSVRLCRCRARSSRS